MEITQTRADVTLLTPTGYRPEAFALCEYWMSRQNFTGKAQWIVVTDETDASGAAVDRCVMGQYVIHRRPRGNDPPHTLSANLRVGLPAVTSDRLLIIEDDEYYAPDYVETMMQWLEEAPLVGEAGPLYYHLPQRKWKRSSIDRHTTLSRTGLQREVYTALAGACRSDGWLVDGRLWRAAWRGERMLRRQQRPLSLGIKGMPGRPGQTGPWSGRWAGWQADPDLAQLHEWLGDDVRPYLPYIGPSRRVTVAVPPRDSGPRQTT